MIAPTDSDPKLLPQTMPTGPAGNENDKVDAMEGNNPMMLNATAKIWVVE